MFTLFKGAYQKNSKPDPKFSYNETFTHRLGLDRILVTTRHRAWVVLNEKEYQLFLKGMPGQNPSLFKLLEDLGITLSEQSIPVAVDHYARRYSFLHSPPTLFILVPTLRCNLDCAYCHAEAISGSNSVQYDMSEETLYKAVDFFFSVPRTQGNQIHIEFQGGEPLLRYDLIKKAMDYSTTLANKQGLLMDFRIVSNLTRIDPDILDDLSLRKNVKISTSLDGPQGLHDEHRSYRNGKGSYARFIAGYSKLREKTGWQISCLPTITRNSLGSETKIIDEYLKHGLTSIYLRYVIKTGRAYEDDSKSIGLDPDQFVQFWQNALKCIFEINKKGTFFYDSFTTRLLGNILSPGSNYMCIRRPCGCGISQVVVGHKGTIHGCDQARSVEMLELGNVWEDSYDEVYTSETVKALRTITSETLPVCRSCPFGAYCGYCVARGINQHGGPIPDVVNDFECQIYKQIIPKLFNYLLNRETAKILLSWRKAMLNQADSALEN